MTNVIEKYRAMLHPSLLKGAGQFEPKLTFAQRCEILALDRVGSKRNQIAAAYKIARPTVAYICNPASRHYKNVRKELHDLGSDHFIEKYLTEEVMKKYNDYADNVHAVLNDADEKIERRTEAEGSGPNRTAKGKTGQFRFWDPIFKEVVLTEVQWMGDAFGVVFVAGPFKDQRWTIPVDNEEGKFNTSQQAYREFMKHTGYEEQPDE